MALFKHVIVDSHLVPLSSSRSTYLTDLVYLQISSLLGPRQCQMSFWTMFRQSLLRVINSSRGTRISNIETTTSTPPFSFPQPRYRDDKENLTRLSMSLRHNNHAVLHLKNVQTFIVKKKRYWRCLIFVRLDGYILGWFTAQVSHNSLCLGHINWESRKHVKLSRISLLPKRYHSSGPSWKGWLTLSGRKNK